jgi:hypothetical protein
LRFTAIARAHCRISASAIRAIGSIVPALLMAMPSPPSCAIVAAIARSTCAGSPTSQGIARALPPTARISCASFSIASAPRADSATGWPRRANSRAVAAPMPRLAPVMKTGGDGSAVIAPRIANSRP